MRFSRPVLDNGPSRAALVLKRATVDNAKIRTWAEAQGINIKPRGRVPEAIRAQYLGSTS